VIPDTLIALQPLPALADPALLAARSALAAQASALGHAHVLLESARRDVPAGDSGAAWHGPAQTAYSSSVRDLAARLDEAAAVLAAARRSSSAAVRTLDARVG
jgi:hypothetical protein